MVTNAGVGMCSSYVVPSAKNYMYQDRWRGMFTNLADIFSMSKTYILYTFKCKQIVRFAEILYKACYKC